MTNLARLITVVVLSTFIFSCEGEDGAVGPQGEQGEQGPQGDPGTANVIYSDWFANEFSNDIIPTSSSFTIPAPELTNNIINEGVILVYGRRVEADLSNRTYQLPIVFGASRQQSYYYSVLNDSEEIRITVVANEQGESVGNGTFFNQYKYVIIPGGQAAGITALDLKHMTYEEIAELFNIK
ncbi:hypothetical protein ACWGOQ_0006460 [Aquimarina sp. M1]